MTPPMTPTDTELTALIFPSRLTLGRVPQRFKLQQDRFLVFMEEPMTDVAVRLLQP